MSSVPPTDGGTDDCRLLTTTPVCPVCVSQGAVATSDCTGDSDSWSAGGAALLLVQRHAARRLRNEDTAVFNLMNTYAVNVAGARAKRIVIRNSSIDLVGGTAEATASALAEPSLVVGQNGKLHLVSGALTTACPFRRASRRRDPNAPRPPRGAGARPPAVPARRPTARGRGATSPRSRLDR